MNGQGEPGIGGGEKIQRWTAGRKAAVSLGTNGGSTYTRSSDTSVGSRTAARLISETTYHDDGTVATTKDPKGIEAHYTYDAAGRRTLTVANYDDGAAGPNDKDQATEYTYANGLLTHLIAHLPSAVTQDTEYTYGVSLGDTPPSELVSNRLLRQVTYPPGGGDVVVYAYDRLGEQVATIDQAGNEIDTVYDLLGRETSRVASAINTGAGFDDFVQRIDTGYNPRGMVSTVTQYDDASATNVRDQVAFEYDGWGNIEKFHQDVDSAMSPPGTSSAGRGAFTVQYSVSKATPSGGARTLRRDAAYSKAAGSTFAQAGFDYGSGDIADLMSRVQGLTTGSSPVTVATYDYLGAGQLVGTTLDQAGLNTSVFTEAVGVHTYCDVDDFNRPTRWNWVRIGAGGGAAGGFYNTQIAYDENSNPIYTLDDAHVRNSNGKHLFDVVYGLDDLNRVTSADEGNATGSPPSLSIQTSYHTRTELWNSLTLTGNWGNRRLDIDGDGAFSGPDDRDEQSGSNVFTAANEWTARSSAVTASAAVPVGSSPAPANNRAGLRDRSPAAAVRARETL